MMFMKNINLKSKTKYFTYSGCKQKIKIVYSTALEMVVRVQYSSY